MKKYTHTFLGTVATTLVISIASLSPLFANENPFQIRELQPNAPDRQLAQGRCGGRMQGRCGGMESAVAVVIAENDGVVLTDSHCEILLFLRSYYEESQISPPDIRTLSKVLKHALGEDKGSKEQLSTLFFEPLLETVCRYAGLPKPIKGGCG